MTLYTSDEWSLRYRRLERSGISHFLGALFLIFFGAVYERFSHEVYSYHMLYAFAWPLVLGVLPCLVLTFQRARRLPSLLALQCWGAGIWTLAVGSLVRGALVIYGTDHPWLWIYSVLGALLLGAGAMIYGLERR